jgi:Putative beta barrel porin-7 (BBP7)
MRNGFLTSVASLLIGAGLAAASPPLAVPFDSAGSPAAAAQLPSASPPPDKSTAPAAPAAVKPPDLTATDPHDSVPLADTDSCARPRRCYFDAEYLMWWTKGDPVPPLATESTLGNFLTNPAAGSLSDPNTSVVLGGHDLVSPMRYGFRLTGGEFLDGDHTFAVEANYFLLDRQTTTLAVSNNGLPNAGAPLSTPVLAVPFFDVTIPGASSIVLSFPSAALFNGPFAGYSTLSVSTFLESGEANGVWNMVNEPGLRLAALAGFRCLVLREDLAIYDQAITPAQLLKMTMDKFDTQDTFYGGQLGVRGEVTRGRFFLEGAVKAALGNMHDTLDISGASALATPKGVGILPGGLFAQPTNSGNRSQDEFAVVPEITLNVGVNIGRHLRAFVGYDFLYVSSVIRPGSQIDTNLNLTQSSFFNGGTLVGPAAPQARFNTSDYWAQGLNFGLQIRF